SFPGPSGTADDGCVHQRHVGRKLSGKLLDKGNPRRPKMHVVRHTATAEGSILADDRGPESLVVRKASQNDLGIVGNVTEGGCNVYLAGKRVERRAAYVESYNPHASVQEPFCNRKPHRAQTDDADRR